MPLINRDNDPSEKKEWEFYFNGNSLGIPVGSTLFITGPMPYPYQIQSAVAYALGMSGAPQLAFGIFRPLPVNASLSPGGGNTVMLYGFSNMVVPNGYSGSLPGYSGLAPQNSTLLIGNAGDILTATTIGANTACTQLFIQIVWKKTQDIVSHNGIST